MHLVFMRPVPGRRSSFRISPCVVGLVVWDDRFRADDAPAEGAPTCEDGAHLPLVARVGARLAAEAQAFLLRGERSSFLIPSRSGERIF